MQDQHTKITGYRDLSQDEIDLINKGKMLAMECGVYIAEVMSHENTDKRCVALGKTNMQQGFMWAIRSIAKPDTF